MKQKLIFSIIIPTLNSEEMLKKCLESVVNQSFRDFEILIMDGLSTDNTLGIVKSFNDERIKIFSGKDEGIYDAMNKGIDKTNGEWLYFLGSDDELYNIDILLKVYNFILKNEVDIVYGNVYSSRFNGVYDGHFTKEKLEQKNICHQSMFFNRSVFRKIGTYNLKYKGHADWHHNLRCFFSPKIRTLYLDEVIANYSDGGYSSMFGDDEFAKMKSWELQVFKKNELSFKKKMKRICKEFLWRKKMFGYIQACNFLMLDSYKLVF